MTKVDTWMPVYWGDYAKDTGHLGAVHHGAYLMLIKHYWVTGEALPDDDAQLWRIACADSIQHWRKLRMILAPLFEVAGGRWRHVRIERELALALKRQEKARRAAGIRWASPEHPPIADAPSMPEHCPGDARHNSPSPNVTTTTLTVTPSGSAGRATLLPDGWMPDEADVTQLRKGRPEIVGELYDRRMQDFRDWTKASAKTSHDWPATWRGFMRQTKLPPESKFPAKPDATALPPSEPWEQRMRGYKPGGFWKPNDWGPPPERPNTRVPPSILATWRQGATQ